MRPLFFGTPGSQLYGAHYPAQGRTSRNAVVVICQPPQEHECVDALRALRLLAGRLARQGFHVLRFDWFGTGDSAGEAAAATLERWTTDIDDAIRAAKAESGLLRVVLIGLRLGATLAARAAADRTDLDGLVLWEPIVRGDAFVHELRADHAAFVAEEIQERPGAAAYVTDDEIRGQALPPGLATEISAIDLDSDGERTGTPTLVVLNRGAAGGELGGFESGEVRRVDEAPVWAAHAGFDAAPVPSETLQAIQGWIVGLRR